MFQDRQFRLLFGKGLLIPSRLKNVFNVPVLGFVQVLNSSTGRFQSIRSVCFPQLHDSQAGLESLFRVNKFGQDFSHHRLGGFSGFPRPIQEPLGRPIQVNTMIFGSVFRKNGKSPFHIGSDMGEQSLTLLDHLHRRARDSHLQLLMY